MAFPSRCGIPSECYGLVPSVPGVTLRAGMQLPLWGEEMSHGDNAYQPGAMPWVCHASDSRVPRERGISSDGGHVTDQPRCGIPSGRIHCGISVPRVSPWADMHGSVGAKKCPRGTTHPSTVTKTPILRIECEESSSAIPPRHLG